MKNIKDVLFNEALFHKDRARELTKELGEFDRLVAISEARYHALLTVIEESGLYNEWEAFLKDVFLKRQQFEKLNKEDASEAVNEDTAAQQKEKAKATLLKYGDGYEIAIVDDTPDGRFLRGLGKLYKQKRYAKQLIKKQGFDYVELGA